MKWFVLAIATIMIGGAFILSSVNKVTSEPISSPQVLGVTSTQEPIDSMLGVINDYRIQNGLEALQMSPEIKELANYRVSDMVSDQYYAHTSPENLTYADIISNYVEDSTVSCENLQLQNSELVQEAVAAWMKSASHKKCLLNPKLTRGAIASSYYDEISNRFDSNSATYVFVFIGSN